MSATGNPRNKVALKPGHSLMDWIRLGNSGEDLTGTGGALLQVTKDQLAKHSSQEDAWMCIRGNVYNITRYMHFHPGGVDELMKGAGIDATNLFNQVHPWVNFESILRKCLIGRLSNAVDKDVFSLPQTSKITISTSLKVSNAVTASTVLSDIIKVDWYQQEKFITLVVYLKELPQKLQISNEVREELWIWLNSCWLGWSLDNPIIWPPLITVAESKVEAKFTKDKALHWPEPKKLEDEMKASLSSIPMIIKKIEKVNHNVFLISLNNTKRCFYYVPIGYHLQLKSNINGHDIERFYTPVCGLENKIPYEINLMIKFYPDGIFSSWITSRKEGDIVTVGQPLGTFSTVDISKATHLVLIAAGTGFTPMSKIIHWAMARRAQIKEVKLIFFNKAEKDIIWKSDLESLASNNKRFRVEHVLSEADSIWKKERGWITPQLLQKFIPDFSKDDPLRVFYVCACGPVSFTQLTERYLQDMGYPQNNYFCFRG